jgi:beta-lactamase regulating signal transducer with metallopeptidase domain
MADILKLFLEISLMASAMTGIIVLIRSFLSKRMHPAVMLLLWGMVLLRLLLPFTLASPVKLVRIPVQAVAYNANDTPLVKQRAPFITANDSSLTEGNAQITDQNTSRTTPGMAVGQTNPAPISLLKNISIWDAAVIVWMAGILAALLLFLKKVRKFKKRLCVCNPVADPGILAIIERHREKTGVKRAVLALECDFVHAPSVFGYFRPCILIPPQFARHMERDSLEAILLHEVCHIRCRDILMNYIWLLARALHWFNPLVWLAFKWFEDDVELGRDQKVARMLLEDGALVYGRSLLEAARFSKQTSPVPSPTTALFENRCKLKRRVYRLVKPQKRSRASVAASALLAVCMLLACFTTACQPTPEKPPVISKNADVVQEVLQANSEESKPALVKEKQVIDEQIKKLGGHIKMEMKPNKNVSINVDADIIPPGNGQIPLVRVRPKNLSKEQFETWIKYLTNSQPLVYRGESFLSKEEFGAILPKLKGYAANKKLPKHIKNHIDGVIRDFQERFRSAAGKASEKPYDGTLIQQDKNKYFSYITELKCYMGKNMAARLSLWQSFNETQNQITFDNNDYGSMYNTFEPYTGAAAERIKMTYAEAKAKAEDFVRKVDGENSSLAVYNSSIGYELGTFANYTKETSPQAYAFSFARSYGGIAVKPVRYLGGGSEKIDYSKQISPESLSVVIDDNGISSASWNNYSEFIENVSPDQPLIDFDRVREIFEQHCQQKFTWVPRDDSLGPDLKATLTVKRVELNLMVIPEKDNLENYITVPVWDFIGDMVYDEKYVAQDGYPANEEKDVSIVTVNAANGSIIDREQGF